MTTLKRYFLEPVNTLTHLVGAIASLAGLIIGMRILLNRKLVIPAKAGIHACDSDGYLPSQV